MTFQIDAESLEALGIRLVEPESVPASQQGVADAGDLLVQGSTEIKVSPEFVNSATEVKRVLGRFGVNCKAFAADGELYLIIRNWSGDIYRYYNDFSVLRVRALQDQRYTLGETTQNRKTRRYSPFSSATSFSGATPSVDACLNEGAREYACREERRNIEASVQKAKFDLKTLHASSQQVVDGYWQGNSSLDAVKGFIASYEQYQRSASGYEAKRAAFKKYQQ